MHDICIYINELITLSDNVIPIFDILTANVLVFGQGLIVLLLMMMNHCVSEDLCIHNFSTHLALLITKFEHLFFLFLVSAQLIRHQHFQMLSPFTYVTFSGIGKSFHQGTELCRLRTKLCKNVFGTSAHDADYVCVPLQFSNSVPKKAPNMRVFHPYNFQKTRVPPPHFQLLSHIPCNCHYFLYVGSASTFF